LSGQQSGLEFIEIVLRYLGSAAEMPKEDLKRAVIQALPEGEQLMATPAEQWIQEGLEQGERKVLLRQVHRRFGEAAAQQRGNPGTRSPWRLRTSMPESSG
jgi:hypothetical protein